MRRRSHWPAEEQIRRLETELYLARYTILELLPEPFSTLLQSYSKCQNRDDTYGWGREVAEQIASLARPIPEYTKWAYPEYRAYCPLCGYGGSGPYRSGYSIPGGLCRHLLGEGNVTRCRVMEAAMALARDYWDDQFLEAEIEAQRAQQVERDRRRKSETLYLIDPTRKPVLIDESLSYGEEPRNERRLSR